MTELKAVLFDLDGTLFDTERLWAQAVLSVAPLSSTEMHFLAGRSVADTARYLGGLGLGDLTNSLLSAFEERVLADATLQPGALALLESLVAQGISLALVTASPRSIASAAIAGLDYFSVVVTADDTARTKPHPDPYLLALSSLGVSANACVVVEDTLVGVTSASAAGCVVVAVLSTMDIPPAPGRLVVPSLSDVSVDMLRSVLSG